MTWHKFIVTHSWGNNPDNNEYRNSNAFILPNNSDHSLNGYLKMLCEAKKSFPELKPTEAECLTVLFSSWCKGFPCLRFPVPPDTQAEGWRSVIGHLPDIVLN